MALYDRPSNIIETLHNAGKRVANQVETNRNKP